MTIIVERLVQIIEAGAPSDSYILDCTADGYDTNLPDGGRMLAVGGLVTIAFSDHIADIQEKRASLYRSVYQTQRGILVEKVLLHSFEFARKP